MSANPAVSAKVSSSAFLAVLYGGAVATTAAVVVSSAEAPGLETIAQQILQVGAPTMIGTAVAGIVSNPFAKGNKHLSDYVVRGLIAGSAGAIVLIAAGAIPAVLDVQTIGFIALVGGSAIGGELLANAIEL